METEREYWGTLGPKSCSEPVLEELLKSGMNGIRLNLSHSDLASRKDWIQNLHQAVLKTDKPCRFLIDLQGPEMRIKKVNEPFLIEEGNQYSFKDLGIDLAYYPHLEAGTAFEIDDGKLHFKAAKDNQAIALNSGNLYSNKSLHIDHLKNDRPVMTQADLDNLKQASSYGVDAVMQPFVRSGNDLTALKEAIGTYAPHLKIYSKIENRQGLENIQEILKLSNVLVIARGDLANDVGLENIGLVQHYLAQKCKEAGKPFLVVTQMLDSMRHSDAPTRAEANDVFTAVWQGASALMLTGEVAAGDYPVEAMKFMVDCAKKSDNYLQSIQ